MKILLISLFVSIATFGYSQSNSELPQLKIAKVVPTAGLLSSEFEDGSDWLSILNSGDHSIDLSEFNIYISDDPSRLFKFKLRKKVLAPNSMTIVWCDEYAKVRKDIHTNFKLAASGETITITLKTKEGIHILDQVHYEGMGLSNNVELLRTDAQSLTLH